MLSRSSTAATPAGESAPRARGWLWLVLVVIVLVLVVTLVVSRRGGDASDPSQRARTALSILEDRYARGEIDREEFQQRRDDLLDEGR